MRQACAVLGIARATMQPRVKPRVRVLTKRKANSERALTDSERGAILAAAHTDRLADFSVREIYATLLDEGIYLASISTMYRVLRHARETRERRRLATHPASIKPELAATAPNQVWSWDLRKLLGPQKWTYYHLYVVLDVYNRFVVGWRLESRESAALAKELFTETIEKERVDPSGLTVHSDGGTSMTSKTLTQLFADLGIVKSRSRPHVSNDNPFIESHYKTLKYCPTFPGAFANIEQARAYCRRFFACITQSIGTREPPCLRPRTYIAAEAKNAEIIAAP